MTNKEKEAVDHLSSLLDDEYAFTEKDKAVFRLAIKALEQEPCDDAISRHKAKEIDFDRICVTVAKPSEMIRQKIDELPPVQPARPKGHWIDGKCSECGNHAPYRRMANKEIIEGLEIVKSECGKYLDEGFAWICQPIDAAIKALKAEDVQPIYCEYCHEDFEGYVKSIEKNGHAFVRFGIDGWELNLKANGWHGSALIRYCPMCGRELFVQRLKGSGEE